MVKSMLKLCLAEFSDCIGVFSPVRVLCNRPQVNDLFHAGEQERVRWCQIRRIWRVINQFKATITHCTADIATTDLCAGALSW